MPLREQGWEESSGKVGAEQEVDLFGTYCLLSREAEVHDILGITSNKLTVSEHIEAT